MLFRMATTRTLVASSTAATSVVMIEMITSWLRVTVR